METFTPSIYLAISSVVFFFGSLFSGENYFHHLYAYCCKQGVSGFLLLSSASTSF